MLNINIYIYTYCRTNPQHLAAKVWLPKTKARKGSKAGSCMHTMDCIRTLYIVHGHLVPLLLRQNHQNQMRPWKSLQL